MNWVSISMAWLGQYKPHPASNPPPLPAELPWNRLPVAVTLAALAPPPPDAVLLMNCVPVNTRVPADAPPPPNLAELVVSCVPLNTSVPADAPPPYRAVFALSVVSVRVALPTTNR